jgi:hypothetical protein
MKTFLESAKGGAWYNSEIITLVDPSYEDIIKAKRAMKADYTITLFSGHGFEDDFGKKFLALSNGEFFRDKRLLNTSIRQLILIDSCRNFIRTGLSGVGIGDPWPHFDAGEAQLKIARSVYDRWIKESLPGKLILHSTQSGKYSYDTRQGGIFTQNLINAGNNVKVDEKIKVNSIYATALRTVKLIEDEGYDQKPNITFKEGNVRLPFALSFPEPKFIRRSLRKPEKSNNNAGLVFGLLALGLLIAARD